MTWRVRIGPRRIRTTVGTGGLTYVDVAPRGVAPMPGRRGTRLRFFVALAVALLAFMWLG